VDDGERHRVRVTLGEGKVTSGSPEATASSVPIP